MSDLGTYVGQLDEDGKFVGDGSFYYKDCWYEGSFQNGNREGNGTMHFADGRIVVGEFAKDEMTRKVSEK